MGIRMQPPYSFEGGGGGRDLGIIMILHFTGIVIYFCMHCGIPIVKTLIVLTFNFVMIFVVVTSVIIMQSNISRNYNNDCMIIS